MKKLFSLLLALMMMLGVSALGTGALADDGSILNLDSMFPVTTQPVELEFCIRYDSSTFTDFEDLWWWHYMQEKTNVTVVPRMIASDVWNEQSMIMLASGDLPDVFFVSGWTNSEIYTNGVEEGIFLPLTEYVNDANLMPNLNAAFEQYPEAKAASILPDGNLYGLPYMISDLYVMGGATRAQWLNAWLTEAGIDWKTIRTLDDFYQALVAVKNADHNGNGEADEIPWSQFWGSDGANGMNAVVAYILGAYGVATTDGLTGVNLKTNQGGYLPMTDAYYDAISFLAKLYAEGLLDNDLFSQSDTDMVAKFASDQVAFSTYWNPNIYAADVWPAHDESGFDNSVITTQTPLVSSEGNTPIAACGARYGTNVFVVTSACQYPEVAMRWADACYDAKTAMYYRVGAEYGSEDDDWLVGLDYDLDTYIDTDWAAAKEHWGATDVVGWQWINLHIASSSSVPYFGTDEKPGQLLCIDPDLVEKAPRTWLSPYQELIQPYEVGGFPSLYYSGEDNRVIELYKSSLDTFVIEQTAKFIAGLTPLNEATWAEFQEKLKAFNAEDYNAVLSNAYDLYAAN